MDGGSSEAAGLNIALSFFFQRVAAVAPVLARNLVVAQAGPLVFGLAREAGYCFWFCLQSVVVVIFSAFCCLRGENSKFISPTCDSSYKSIVATYG